MVLLKATPGCPSKIPNGTDADWQLTSLFRAANASSSTDDTYGTNEAILGIVSAGLFPGESRFWVEDGFTLDSIACPLNPLSPKDSAHQGSTTGALVDSLIQVGMTTPILAVLGDPWEGVFVQ